MIPLKRLAEIVAGQSPPSEDVSPLDGTEFPFLQGNAEFGPLHPAPKLQCDTAPRWSAPGDVLLSVRAPVGALNVADRHYGIGRGLCAIRPRHGFENRYVWWALHAVSAGLQAVATGSTYDAVTAEDVGASRLPAPPLDEQRAIADYLDRETARIDALIAAKERELDLLAELFAGRRDTTFADLSAPVTQLGRFVRSIGQGTSPQAEDRLTGPGEWGVLKLSAVKAGVLNPLEHKALPADVVPIPSLVPRVGDLLVTRANTPELVGDACAVRESPARLMLCDLIYVLRLSPNLDARFAAEALLTRSARGQLSSAARGTSQSMVKLRGEDVKSVKLPVPSVDAQRVVIDVLDSERDRHLQATRAVRRSVVLLRERRQVLITATVTGQLEVRVAA